MNHMVADEPELELELVSDVDELQQALELEYAVRSQHSLGQLLMLKKNKEI